MIIKLRKEIKETESLLLIKIKELIDNDDDFRNHVDILYSHSLDNCDIIKKEYDRKFENLERSIKKIPKEIAIKNVLSI